MTTEIQLLSRYRRLAPTENVDPSHVIELEKQIIDCGRWIMPIVVNRDHLFVMDGHHRLAIAKRLRLAVLPVIFLDYGDVDVVAWRQGEVITPDRILEMARSGHKFPCKTTRHIFRVPIPRCDHALEDLQRHVHPPGTMESSGISNRTLIGFS